MEEYPKRLYLKDGTAVTVQDAADEQRWLKPSEPADQDQDSGHDSPLKKAVKKAFGKGATDA